MNTTQISAQRIAADIETIGSLSECDPAIGYSRPTFSDPWREARDYVIAEGERFGGETRIDAFGNVHIRRAETGGGRLVWLCGSHLDSVPSGGKYDGVMGVVIALEVFRVAPDVPLEVIIFAEEEGTTFGLGMLGSRSWAGEVSPTQLAALKNRHGLSFVEAGALYGVDPRRMEADRLHREQYRGMIEVHAEQGLELWKTGIPAAAVTRINGRREYEVRFSGQGNHAGSTRMTDRRDALTGASEAILMIEALGRRLDQEQQHSVMTVGCVRVQPNAMNVIPGQAIFTVDFRAQEEQILDNGEQRLREELDRIAVQRDLGVEVAVNERVSPSPLDETLRKLFQEAARRLGKTLPEVPSGALHDAARIATCLPAGMLFVGSRDGISHDPREYSRNEDIVEAAEIVLETVRG